MDKEGSIRKQIRKIIEELYDLSHYPFSYMGNNKFPYTKESAINGNNLEDFYYVYNSFSKNQDVFDWPEKEFKKGIDLEKQKKPTLGILELAEIVISNLKKDIKYYEKVIYV